MSKQDLINDFVSNLTELEQGLNQLNELLIEEQNALNEKKLTELERLAARKTELTQTIEQAEKLRRTYCASLQIEPDKKSLQLWLQDKPEKLRITIARLWQKITYLGQKCANQNQLNGILVIHQERHTRDALSILRGTLSDQESYSDNGAHKSDTSKQFIAKA